MHVMDHIDRALRRCWLAWRYIYCLGYRPGVAWTKAARRG